MREELKNLMEVRMILGGLSSRIKKSYGPFDFSSLERKEIYPQKNWIPLIYLFVEATTIIRRDPTRKEIMTIPLYKQEIPSSIWKSPAIIKSDSYFIEYPKIKNYFPFLKTTTRYFPTLYDNFLLGRETLKLIIKTKEDQRNYFVVFPGVIFFGEEIVAMIATKEALSIVEERIDPEHFKMPTDFSSLYGLFISRTFSKNFPNFFQTLWKRIAVPMIGLGCSVFMVEEQQEMNQYFFPRDQQFKNMMPHIYKKKITEMDTSSSDPFEGLYRNHIRRADRHFEWLR